MGRAPGLFRLLRMRQLEEEHCRTALESALAEFNRLVDAQSTAAERERQGRMLALESARTGALSDRLAGLEEARISRELQISLSAKIETARKNADECRARYLEKRIERRQLEMLLEAADAKAAQNASRRTQQKMDDGHRSREHRSSASRKPSSNAQAKSDSSFMTFL